MALKQNGKIILSAVLVIAASFFLWRHFQGSSVIQEDVSWVCVVTGEKFSFSRTTRPPAVNPSTNNATVLPVYNKDGKLYVDSHYQNLFEKLYEVNQYVDPNTLEVLEKPRQ